MYENVIQSFEDSLNDEVFETFAFNMAVNELKNSKNHLNFLIAPPGAGKSFLLTHTFKDAIFLKALLTKEEIDNNLTTQKLIIIDEAQLLEPKLIEYIRILTDTKQYRFLLSMHLKEAKEILEKEHFKSRSINIVELKPITKEEMNRYINKKLLLNNANHLFSKKEFSTIYNYTKGNFRNIKKFSKTIFELLDFATKNNIKKHMKINSCLITMAALHLGFIND